MLFNCVLQQRKAADQIDAKEILAQAEYLEVKDIAPLVLVELLLDDKILQQLKKYRKLFLLVSLKSFVLVEMFKVKLFETFFRSVFFFLVGWGIDV